MHESPSAIAVCILRSGMDHISTSIDITVQVIKADLPNTPDDVIDIWLLPHSKRKGFGWPPRKNNEWKYVLGLDRAFSDLQKLRWELEEIIITPEVLNPSSKDMIEIIYQSYASDGYKRVADLVAYMMEYGKFPRPVILEKTPEGYSVLDGSHRITAYFYLCGYFKAEDKILRHIHAKDAQSAWIAGGD